MTSSLNTVAIQRMLRALEQFNKPNAARVEMGYFEVQGAKYGIRAKKCYYNPEYGNELSTIELMIQYPSSSGLVWITIGEFSTLHPLSFMGYTPKIRIDKNWITYKAAPEQSRVECEISVAPMKGVARRHTFDVFGEELEDECFLFQQSLIMEEEALFGVCCSSWLYHMKMQFIYIICEFDVDEMNRIHKVVFDDDRP